MSSFTTQDFDFDKYGAFFCFGYEQFNARKKEGVTYVDIGGGLVCPKENAKQMMSDLSEFSENECKRELKERGREETILYHLRNYECGYSGDLTQAIETLEGYGIGEEEVREVYRKHKNSL